MNRPRDLAPSPRRLFTQLALLVAWATALWHLRDSLSGHGYALFPPSPNAWFAIHSAAAAALPPALVLWALLLLPWRQSLAASDPRRRLASIWGILPAAALWALWGYRFNRFDAAAAWKRRVDAGAFSIPEAVTDPGVLGPNLLATLVAAAAAWILYRLCLRFLPRTPMDSRLRIPPLFGALLLSPLLLFALLPPASLRPVPDLPDIVLISLDATRADHFGVYGSEGGFTPVTDAFAEEAEVFERAYAPEPWTLTSHMTMLTGLYPDAHGLDFGRALPRSIWMVSERLRDAGYRTHATVRDCFLLSPRFGYGAGFDHYRESDEPAAKRCVDAADWLLADERPGFLFLHLYDPHSDTRALPYEAGPEALERFAPGAAELFRAWAGRDGASETLRELNEAGTPLPPDHEEALRALYAAGLWETDRALGQLFERMAEAGRLENALVIITSDHGEALGEQAHYMHERHMDATLRIPLIIRWPGGRQAGQRRDEIVELVDLAPTILAAAGLPQEEVSQGHRLDAPLPRRDFAFHRSGLDYAISTANGWRLVYRRDPDVYGVSLRRIDGSPGDGEDVLADSLDFVQRWQPALEEMHRANELLASRFRGGKAVAMSELDVELLRSLGYID